MYASTADLAARWGVSVTTVRNIVKTAGFPEPLTLGTGARSRRWPIEGPGGVAQWEKHRTARARHVVTGTRPQHHRTGLPAPVKVGRRRTAQAA